MSEGTEGTAANRSGSVAPGVVATAPAVPAIEPIGAAELWISTLLRWGVLSSVAVIGVGMLLTFVHHPDYFSSADALSRLTKPTSAPHTLSDVLGGAEAVKGQSLVMVGLLMLLSIPVTRVGLSLWLFIRQREWAYVAITALVLTLLLVSFGLGRAGE